jgi:serine/threonine protein kinase
MSLAPGTRFGAYEIVSQIGEGGMGLVYRARDTKLNRDVALKALPDLFASDAGRLGRFNREAQALASLNHPNIAHIHGLEESGGVRALVMELVEGDDLSQHIARGPIPIDEAVAIATQVAEALEAAHEQGIVHRDLKPANVKLRPDGTVKVLDFGLAKVLERMGAAAGEVMASPTITSPAMTQMGVILGTPAYMSPEQARGRAVDKRTDIWSFGCLLYEMLTGQRAFTGDTITDTLAGVLEREPDWSALPAGVPASIRRLLIRCLRKDLHRRLHDVSDAILELEDEALVPADLAATGAPPSRTWRRALVSGASVLALGLVLAVVIMTQLPRPSVEPRPLIVSALMPPSGVRFDFIEDYQFGPPAISPDGQHVTYSAARVNGQPGLFLRSLSSAQTRELPGTENGFYPFWSPDSRFIAFFASGALKKIALDDGTIDQITAGIGNGRGGSWSSDDVILFTPDYFTQIKKVSAQGGEVTDATVLDQTRGEKTNRFPWFLPDGKHFLYTAQRPIGFYNRSTVRLGSLESPASEILFDADSNVMYANGFLLYIRENTSTLVAEAFDTEKLRRTGQPLTVAESVGTIRLTSCGIFTVSANGRLVYQTGPDALPLTWVDRQGKRSVATGFESTMYTGEIHATPDRAYLAANIQSPTGLGSNIWIYDIARTLLSPLTTDNRAKSAGTISPDGRVAVYDATNGGPNGWQDLYRQAVDKSSREQLLFASKANKRPLSWSRDGRLLLFSSDSLGAVGDLYVLPTPLAAGGPGRPFLFMPESGHGVLSPDEPYVAFTAGRMDATEVYVGRIHEPGRERVSIRRGTWPRWREDGRELFYVEEDTRQMMAVDVKRTGNELHFGTPHRLPIGRLRSTGGFTYEVSRDGQRFLAALAGDDKGNEPLTLVHDWTARAASSPSTGRSTGRR